MAAAAAEKSRKRLRVEATCSICLDLFRDPVTLDCGDNFCQACIEKWWGDAPTGTARGTTCPGCRERVQPWRLKRNKELANMAEILKEMTPEQAGRKVCERHQEPLKLFCKDDAAPICVVCNVSKEHRDHNVVPLQEAAQEHKDRICSSLETLRQEREKILACKADTEKESQALLEQVEAESEKTVSQFQQLRQQLHQFLEEQEKLLLAQMDEAGKEIARQRVEHLAKISEKLSSVEGKMQEMEEKRQQPASELLQDITSTLKKCEENKFEKSVVFSPALKWRIWDVSDKNLFLESFMEMFQDTLISGLQLKEDEENTSEGSSDAEEGTSGQGTDTGPAEEQSTNPQDTEDAAAAADPVLANPKAALSPATRLAETRQRKSSSRPGDEMCEWMMDAAASESDRLLQAMDRGNATFERFIAEKRQHMDRDYGQGERMVDAMAAIGQSLQTMLTAALPMLIHQQAKDAARGPWGRSPGPQGDRALPCAEGAGSDPGRGGPSEWYHAPVAQELPPASPQKQTPPPAARPHRPPPPPHKQTPPPAAQPCKPPPPPHKQTPPPAAQPHKPPPPPQQEATPVVPEESLTPELVGFTPDLDEVMPDWEPLTPGEDYLTPDLDQLPLGQGSFTLKEEQPLPTPEQEEPPPIARPPPTAAPSHTRTEEAICITPGGVTGRHIPGGAGEGAAEGRECPPVLRGRGRGQGRVSSATPPATRRSSRARAGTAPSVLMDSGSAPGQVAAEPAAPGFDACRSPPAKVGRVGARGRARTM